jgi:hypothetical protein
VQDAFDYKIHPKYNEARNGALNMKIYKACLIFSLIIGLALLAGGR